MVSCEKCWEDAYIRNILDPTKNQITHYYDLLTERKDHHCSWKEVAGQFGDKKTKSYSH